MKKKANDFATKNENAIDIKKTAAKMKVKQYTLCSL